MRKLIKIKCQNGISFKDALKDIFFELHDLFEFEESNDPDFILFGPYGNDIPQKGNYIRIGYYCENVIPDLSICEWAFGIPLTEYINHPKYKRIQWHGLDPHTLVKQLSDNDIDRILQEKKSFCNFFYSHEVPYREAFFKQLSKYKKVDAPGKSMNNMGSIDELYQGNRWERKRKFVSEYKFTIAFENYSYPGYQTEKLYDAMEVNSLPIYCGDPNIGEIFNTDSFLNAPDYLKYRRNGLVRSIEALSQQTFVDIRPQFFKSPLHRMSRKLKYLGRKLKMNLQFNNLDFSTLIDRIIEIDQNQDLYIHYLKQPWFNQNAVPSNTTNKDRWTLIFDQSISDYIKESEIS
jgi:hypothetical protein